MRKYKYIHLVISRKTKDKNITKYILSYIKDNGPCKYLKNVVYYNILNELQVFNLSRFFVCDMGFRNDAYDKETMYNIHTYLMNNKTNNKISMSIYKRSILKSVKNYCINHYPRINYFIHKRGIKEALNINKNINDNVDYMYNEENIG